jgi:hypothetical protein
MSQEVFHLVWHVKPAIWAVKKIFVGKWRITELEGFDAGYVDLCGPGMLDISTRGHGYMNFGAIEIMLDCKTDDLDERVLRFSYEGQDEGDSICGRGYCLLDGDQMTGRIFRHLGDEFRFKAKRMPKNKTAQKRPKTSAEK